MRPKQLAGAVAVMFAVSGVTMLVTPVVASGSLHWVGSRGQISPLHEAEGTVERVDLARGVLSLKTAAGTLEVQVNENTTFLLAGRRSRFDELRRGQPLRVTYEPSVKMGIAHWVETVAQRGQPAPARG